MRVGSTAATPEHIEGREGREGRWEAATADGYVAAPRRVTVTRRHAEGNGSREEAGANNRRYTKAIERRKGRRIEAEKGERQCQRNKRRDRSNTDRNEERKGNSRTR
jgi:hypothetical protein